MLQRSPTSAGTVVFWLVAAVAITGLVAVFLGKPAAPLHVQQILVNTAGDGVEIKTAADAAPVARVSGKPVDLARTSPERASCGPLQLMAADVVFDQPTHVMLTVHSSDGSRLSSDHIRAPWWQVSEVRYPEEDHRRDFAEFDITVFPASLVQLCRCPTGEPQSSNRRDDGAVVLRFRVPLGEDLSKQELTFGSQRKPLVLLGLPPSWMTRDDDSHWQVEPGKDGWYLRGAEDNQRHWCQPETFDTPWSNEAWHLVVIMAKSARFAVAFHTIVNVEFEAGSQQLIWNVGGEDRAKAKNEVPNIAADDTEHGETRRMVHQLKAAPLLANSLDDRKSIRLRFKRSGGRVRFAVENVDGRELSAISLPESSLERSRPRCGLWLWNGRLGVSHFDART